MQLKISFPPVLLGLLDEVRGDVSRSLYLQRILEAHLRAEGKETSVS